MKQPKSSMHLHDSSWNQESKGHDLVAQTKKPTKQIDRISDLPDSVLGIILSPFPTNEAVRTSVLSKRWKFAWVTIQNFEFGFQKKKKKIDFSFVGDQIKVGDEVTKFNRFVDRVFLLHDAGLLNKFHLYWDHNGIPSRAISWIKSAIKRNVHDILLSVWTRFGCTNFQKPLDMPSSVFNCDSLRSLKLIDNITLSGTAFCLPRLESLKLDSVFFNSEEAFEIFIRGCPMLKYLHLNMDLDDMYHNYELDDFTYIISSTSLRHLKVNFVRYSYFETRDKYFSLRLEACSLEYLKLKGFIYEIVVQKNLSSLAEADLRIEIPTNEFSEDFCNSFVEAVRAFKCAKVLSLSADVTWALNLATISLSTEFTRLMKLETRTYCCNCSTLQDLLQSSDNLEVLTIYHQELRHDLGAYPNWIAHAQVPRCLSNSLKKVVVDGYCVGYVREHEMIRYILKHGSVLETMKISCRGYMTNSAKLKLHQEICNFSNKSKVDIS